MRTAKLAPSMLASDFGAFAQAAEDCARAGVDRLHFDVMDGRFVPNISFGWGVLEALRGRSALHFDTHLMIVEPERYIEQFAKAGADTITVQAEATVHLQRTLSQIRSLGAKAGLALNPATPLTALDYVLDDIDLLLVMTVNPGFGGQAYIPAMTAKIAEARRILDQTGRQILLEVDGGIGPANARLLADSGADLLVAGSSVFGHLEGCAGGVRAIMEALEASAP